MIYRILLLSIFAVNCGWSTPAADPPKFVEPPVPMGYHHVKLGEHTFTLPVGFTIEKVASAPQVERPVMITRDDKGRLYVAESSGNTDRATEQIKNPNNKILRLESTKNDGIYDKSTVFADKLSYLQGVMWYKGSVYVGAPPQILKLTDTDDDGKADKREVWHDGGTITGCGNDLHGPYLGLDGLFYWTKGAFSEQNHTLKGGKKFTTRASHVFRAKPDHSDIEVMMTGGMDNPVNVAFNSAGDIFCSCTFVQHPADGKRDAILHCTYGALFGKDHDPVYHHPWTSTKFTEPLTHLGPAAPCGLIGYRTGVFGKDYIDNLFCCQFNLAKVSRHVLQEKGSTYRTIDSDFVTSDNRDFHPTDVIEDKDGSLLIVDTGGWYKICCPSSVMAKNDIFGAIYRVKKVTDYKKDRSIAYKPPVANFESDRLHERRHAAEAAGRTGDAKAIPAILKALEDDRTDATLQAAYTKALIDIGNAEATRVGLKSKNERVLQATLMALEQIPDGKLTAAEVRTHLSQWGSLGDAAWWIATRHSDWGNELSSVFAYFISIQRDDLESIDFTAKRFAYFVHNKELAELIALDVSRLSLRTIQFAKWKEPPSMIWIDLLVKSLDVKRHESIIRAGLQTLKVIPKPKKDLRGLDEAITRLIRDVKQPDDIRLLAMNIEPGNVTKEDWQFAIGHLAKETPGHLRSLALDLVAKSQIGEDGLLQLVEMLPTLSPLDVGRVLEQFTKTRSPKVGTSLLNMLMSSEKLQAGIRSDQIRAILKDYTVEVKKDAEKLYAKLDEAQKQQIEKLNNFLTYVPKGDIRRGQAIFNSAKASCVACHKIGYVGGTIGPDLSKIGSIRSDRDLMEAVVFPSASFVRSYEPVKVNLHDGRTFAGILKKDAPDEVTVILSATEEKTIARKEVDTIVPGTVSIMPAGLDQQMTPQELGDLIAFLKSRR